MSDKQTTAPFRIAIREHGEFVVGYFAAIGTMDEAVELGRIRLSILKREPLLRDAFIELMKLAMSSVALDAGQPIADFDEPSPAPGSERIQ